MTRPTPSGTTIWPRRKPRDYVAGYVSLPTPPAGRSQTASERLKTVPFSSGRLSGWHVDIPTNRVVIAHLPGGRAAAEDFAAAGRVDPAMVRHEISSRRATGNAETFAGRRFELLDGRLCTLGFAVQSLFALPGFGDFGFLTAGHCAPPGPAALIRKQGGDPLGVTASTTFFGPGAGPDQAWIQVTSGDTTDAKVFTYEAPFLVTVRGSQPAFWGESVCRVGPASTDMYACGIVFGNNRNIDFTFESTGATSRLITGLSTLSVCSDPGNSGGPVITAMGQAQGIIIGGPSMVNPATGALEGLSCRSNRAADFLYFQPVNPILSDLGLKLFQPAPSAPAPLRVSQITCAPLPVGQNYIGCRAQWSGGVDLADARWPTPRAPRQPVVSVDPFSRVTTASFDCNNPGETEFTYTTPGHRHRRGRCHRGNRPHHPVWLVRQWRRCRRGTYALTLFFSGRSRVAPSRSWPGRTAWWTGRDR